MNLRNVAFGNRDVDSIGCLYLNIETRRKNLMVGSKIIGRGEGIDFLRNLPVRPGQVFFAEGIEQDELLNVFWSKFREYWPPSATEICLRRHLLT